MSIQENNKRLTITEVAQIIGINPKTIIRWEKTGRIRKSKRDWRGWRIYDQQDVDMIRSFHDAVFEAE